jgi:hypothetical protein
MVKYAERGDARLFKGILSRAIHNVNDKLILKGRDLIEQVKVFN